MSRFLVKIRNFFLTFKVLTFGSAALFYKLKYFNPRVSSEHTFKLRNGLKLTANKTKGNLNHLYDIFVKEVYKFEGDTNTSYNILDIGANRGYFSLYMAQKFPNAKIYAFEPFPETFSQLEDNIKRNHCRNINSYKYAVYDKNGIMDFYSVNWAGCNSLIKDKFEEGYYETTKVSCISFDKISSLTRADKFDFAKIDCEGSEYPILLNSPDEAIRKVKEYVIEVHIDKNYSPKDLIKKLESIGYITNLKKYILRAKLHN